MTDKTPKPKERMYSYNLRTTRAILRGFKGDTRRLVNPQPWEVMPARKGEPVWPYGFRYYEGSTTGGNPFRMTCPFGMLGDLMCVREPIITRGYLPESREIEIEYVADGARAILSYPDRLKPPTVGHGYPNGCFKEAVRIKQPITRVCVERVQDISSKGIAAEGIRMTRNGMYRPEGWTSEKFREWAVKIGVNDSAVSPFGSSISSLSAFRVLWESCGYPWEPNPWVWAVSFKRLEVVDES